MKIYTAPDKVNTDKPIVFLAGGITNCSDWQKEVIEHFKDRYTNWALCNPRRDDFEYSFYGAVEQIEWEFSCIEKCDIFSMYFDYSEESDQPICFYELGRNLLRMQERFPDDWEDRIVISCHEDFKRRTDVSIQTLLATKSYKRYGLIIADSLKNHIWSIEIAINRLNK